MINDDCETVDDTNGDQVVWCTGRKALLGKNAYITGAQLMPVMCKFRVLNCLLQGMSHLTSACTHFFIKCIYMPKLASLQIPLH